MDEDGALGPGSICGGSPGWQGGRIKEAGGWNCVREPTDQAVQAGGGVCRARASDECAGLRSKQTSWPLWLG